MNSSKRKCLLNSLLTVSAVLAAAITLLPTQLRAEEPPATEPQIKNSAPILEPDFYNIGIEYTYSDTRDQYTHRTGTGRFVELVEAPQFIHKGASTFWGGEVASQVITITFKGRWEFTASGSDEVSGEIAASEADWIGTCNLTFALKEDGTKWRIFTGTLPAAFVEPGRVIEVFGYHGVCLGAGGMDGPESGLINKLTYDYRHTSIGERPYDPSLTIAFYQGLSTSDRVSDYPEFMLTGGYRHYTRYGTEDAYNEGEIIIGWVISVESSVNGDAETE